LPEETSEEWESKEQVSGDPFREWYSKEIWGKRATGDDALFEVMSLQVFQAGLTWRMVLSRRDSFRAAFAGWNIDAVADMGGPDVERLREDPGIIRNRQKIQAVIANAGIVLEIQKEHGSFCQWFYDRLAGDDYPSLQKELRATFKFMGPEISRMWLMASGRITREEGDKYDPTV
jgi:DNA-3-methyladenine glycosylase I